MCVIRRSSQGELFPLCNYFSDFHICVIQRSSQLELFPLCNYLNDFHICVIRRSSHGELFPLCNYFNNFHICVIQRPLQGELFMQSYYCNAFDIFVIQRLTKGKLFPYAITAMPSIYECYRDHHRESYFPYMQCRRYMHATEIITGTVISHICLLQGFINSISLFTFHCI